MEMEQMVGQGGHEALIACFERLYWDFRRFGLRLVGDGFSGGR
jgi:hypothetical protein